MTAEPTLIQLWTPDSNDASILFASRHALLGQRLSAPNPTWETTLDCAALPCLAEHQVHGGAVFPAAGYVDAMLSAYSEVGEGTAVTLEALEFRKMLRVGGDVPPRLRAEIVGQTGDFALYSRPDNADVGWILHATARLSSAVPGAPVPTRGLEEVLGRCRQADRPDVLYRTLATCGLQYGPCFRVIRRIWRSPNEVLAELAVHPFVAGDCGRHQIHPTLLDGAFQALAAILPAPDLGGPSYVPTRIERLLFRNRPPARVWSHGRMTKMSARVIEADITLYDEHNYAVTEIRGLRCQALPRRGAGVSGVVPQDSRRSG